MRQHAILSTQTVAGRNISTQASADGARTLTFEHDFRVTGGTLHLYEHINQDVWALGGRRAIFLLPSPIATANFFRIPVAGYDAVSEFLSAGFMCVTVDLIGTGMSSRPADGRAATLACQVTALRDAISAYCHIREIARVDIFGESWGGAIAAELAADPKLVRSVIMESTLYRTSTPALEATARDPRVRGLLDSLPDGYLPVTEQIWGPLARRFPRAVADWTLEHQVGAFPSSPMYAILDLPYFDPTKARVPGLVIHGAEDDRQNVADAKDLADSYGSGSGASLVSLSGAGHVPRVEAVSRDGFWSNVMNFLSR